jgi:hypothetical protein
MENLFKFFLSRSIFGATINSFHIFHDLLSSFFSSFIKKLLLYFSHFKNFISQIRTRLIKNIFDRKKISLSRHVQATTGTERKYSKIAVFIARESLPNALLPDMNVEIFLQIYE